MDTSTAPSSSNEADFNALAVAQALPQQGVQQPNTADVPIAFITTPVTPVVERLLKVATWASAMICMHQHACHKLAFDTLCMLAQAATSFVTML